jgi:hypothetical protein
MGSNVERRSLWIGQVYEVYMAGLAAWERQEGVVTVWTQDTETWEKWE